MAPKQRNTIRICLIILAISLVIMAASTIIHVIHDGWDTLNLVNFVPFISVASAMFIIYSGDRKKDDKQ